MHNSESSKGFVNIEGETLDGKKVSPDATVFNSGASIYHQVKAKEAASAEKKAEREKAVNGIKKKIGAVALAAGIGVAAIAIGNSGESKPLTREQYEDSMKDFAENKANFNINYDESTNSATVTYEDYWRDGTLDEYVLVDGNGDALFESGRMAEKNGSRSASFESEKGLAIANAHTELRSKFAQNNIK